MMFVINIHLADRLQMFIRRYTAPRINAGKANICVIHTNRVNISMFVEYPQPVSICSKVSHTVHNSCDRFAAIRHPNVMPPYTLSPILFFFMVSLAYPQVCGILPY